MGKQKRRGRADRRRRRPAAGEEKATRPLSLSAVERLLVAASEAYHAKDRYMFEQAILLLDDACPDEDPAMVDRSIAISLGRAIRVAWHDGWQPADVVRAASRVADRTAAELSVDVIAADMVRYVPDTVHPSWREQLRALDARVWWSTDEAHLTQWGRRRSLSRAETLRAAVALLSFLHHVPTLPVLCPTPSESTPGRERRDRQWPASKAGSSPELERVRALLTKAESTTFPEEAEALSAKAQELIAMHSIDRIALASQHRDRVPIGRRIHVDNPYAAAKSLLIDRVASANRCRSVWTPAVLCCTVFGGEADVDSVDLLFASLLAQATAALRIADRRRLIVVAEGGARTRSFRQSFHIGYALRIGSRLAGVVAATEAAARTSLGRDLLPALVSHAADVDDALRAAFPRLVQRSLSAGDRQGWASGMAAADVASLTVHHEVDDVDSG